MNYVSNLHSVPEYPAFDSVVNPNFFSQFEAQPHITPTLGIRLQPHFQAAGTDVECISNDSLFTDISPSSIHVPAVSFDLTKLKQNLKLIQKNKNNFFFGCLLLFPTTLRVLLMVLKALRKLLQQWLQVATFKVLYCVGSLTNKLRIFNSNVRSVLLYGCETWRTTQTMQNKIQTFFTPCSSTKSNDKRRSEMKVCRSERDRNQWSSRYCGGSGAGSDTPSGSQHPAPHANP